MNDSNLYYYYFRCEKAFLLFSGVLTVSDSTIPGILSQPGGSDLKQSQLVSPSSLPEEFILVN